MACFIVSARPPRRGSPHQHRHHRHQSRCSHRQPPPDEATQLCKDLAHAAMALSRAARARRGMITAGGIEIARSDADLIEVAA